MRNRSYKTRGTYKTYAPVKRVRLPLYLKILAWFFLNLLLLGGACALLFQAQFQLNLDWLFSAGPRQRLEAVRDLIVGELNTAPTDDWSQVLERFGSAYHVRFALFEEDGRPLIGEVGKLPKEVAARAATENPLQRGRRAHAPLRLLMRTVNPTQYWLLTSARIDNPQAGEPLHVLLVANSESISGGGLIFNPAPWIGVGIGSVVFSLLWWLPLVRGITRSVGQMTAATRQIADGRFDVRLRSRRRDELGSLAESINGMATRLDGFVVGQKRFLGDIAHELCSPLARLQLALGILEGKATEGQEPFVRSAAEKAEQMAALVGELLSFSKASFGAAPVQLAPVNVRAAAEEAVRLEHTDGADVQVEIAPELCVAADRDLLIRALANLVRNAIHYAAGAGPITVRAATVRDAVEIVVADCGPGAPEDELTKIFDPFYRADASRTRETGNAGLGLTIVKACVQSCGGSVAAANRAPHGLAVTIQLTEAAALSDEACGFEP